MSGFAIMKAIIVDSTAKSKGALSSNGECGGDGFWEETGEEGGEGMGESRDGVLGVCDDEEGRARLFILL